MDTAQKCVEHEKLVSKDCPYCVIPFVCDSHSAVVIAVRTVITLMGW